MLKSKVSLDPEYLLGTEGQVKFKKQKNHKSDFAFGVWGGSFELWHYFVICPSGVLVLRPPSGSREILNFELIPNLGF
jgi:hypothetical protein